MPVHREIAEIKQTVTIAPVLMELTFQEGLIYKNTWGLGVVVCACHLSSWGVETGRSEIEDQLQLHSKLEVILSYMI